MQPYDRPHLATGLDRRLLPYLYPFGRSGLGHPLKSIPLAAQM
jgi:hypothetical protein